MPCFGLGKLLLLWSMALFLSACATAPQTGELLKRAPANLPRAALVADVAFYPQEIYQCGPAALAMLLSHSGKAVIPETLVPLVYVPDREGSFQVEMIAATRQYDRLALPVSNNLQSLLHWLANDEPVLVLQNLGPDWYPVWHYAVAIGYDLEQEQLVLHSGVTQNYRVALSTFENTWARSGYWGMVALAPGRLPYPDDARTYFHAAAALEETNSRADMLRVWEAAVAAWPEQPELAMGLANTIYRQGSFDRALAVYRAIVETAPGYLPAYNNLASLQIEMGNAEAAIATAAAGLKVAGGHNAFLQDTLAAARRAHSSSSP